MTREPDRYEAKGVETWRALRIMTEADAAPIIAAALRQAADEALERAAYIAESYGCDYAGKEIRALASPAAAPAVEPERFFPGAAELMGEPPSEPVAPEKDCPEEGCVLEADHSGSCDTEIPEPVAPSLLPRVLAALEAEQLSYDREYPRRKELVALAAELRRYIAGVEADPRDKRIAELETAIRWACGEGDEFPTRQPGEGAYWWRTELRRRAALADGGEG